MKSLNGQLRAFKSSMLERADKAILCELAEGEAQARAEAASAAHLTVGDHAPDFTLSDPDGKKHRLKDYLAKGPVLVLFYRGGWSAPCTLTLRAFEDIAGDCHRAGASILAISPQKASRAAVVAESNLVSFPILIDVGNKVAAAFGIVGEIPPVLRRIYTQMGNNVPDENDAADWRLPRSSEFLICNSGVIHLAHVSPVSYERTEPREALEAMKTLSARILAGADDR
jgi:peroxiredoxin